MTLKEFSDYCNIELVDLLEVLNWMKLLNENNTDWVESLYNDGIVKDLDNISDAKTLKSKLEEYQEILYNLAYSRTSSNETDLIKSFYKDKIKNNESILRFIKTKL